MASENGYIYENTKKHVFFFFFFFKNTVKMVPILIFGGHCLGRVLQFFVQTLVQQIPYARVTCNVNLYSFVR